MLTVNEAKALKQGQIIYHLYYNNADGTPVRAKVLSVKTWKTRSHNVVVSLKRGLYEYFKIDTYQLKFWTTELK